MTKKEFPKPKHFSDFFFSVDKSKVANRLKRVFPKFEAERSHPRGVNGRSKFYKNSAEIFRFRRKYDAIIRARGFQNWQKCPLIFCSIIRGGRMIRQLIIRNQPLSSGFSLIIRPYLQACKISPSSGSSIKEGTKMRGSVLKPNDLGVI